MFLQDIADLEVTILFMCVVLMSTALRLKPKPSKRKRPRKKFATTTSKSIKEFMNGSIAISTNSGELPLKNKLKSLKISSPSYTRMTTHTMKSLTSNSAPNARCSWLIDMFTENAIFAISQMPRATNAMVVANF